MTNPIEKFSAVVAGHICLDVIPDLENLPKGEFNALFQPGHLIQIGPTSFSTGGPVSNTGLALHQLGVPTQLIAKVGNDIFGQAVRNILAGYNPRLTNGLVFDSSASSSYSVIISPPQVDRIFLHCSGANDTFTAADVRYGLVAQVGLFHFGYPPIMRHMYQHGGAELADLLRHAKDTGVTTSVDMAFPDPNSESGRADWHVILEAALPYVDIFLPSIEELLFLLRRETYNDLLGRAGSANILPWITPALLADISSELLAMGVKIVVIKLGARGVYLRTASAGKLALMGRAAPYDLGAWSKRELWAPCFSVQVVGTTGSGDATIAGFLSGLLRDQTPEATLTTAVAVGACNVEAADATSGVPTWERLQQRLTAPWERLMAGGPDTSGWHWQNQPGLWLGPHDGSANT
jgi:sugar/nucleoside kinase (ribokinase family)